MIRTEAEIRAEIVRVEALVPTLRRQYEKTAAYVRMTALRWALGEDES